MNPKDIGTRMNLNKIKRTCSRQGIARNAKSQSAYDIATNLTPPGHATEINHDSASRVKDKFSPVASHPGPNGVVAEPRSCTKVGASLDKTGGSSNEIEAKAKEKENPNPNAKASFQFFVQSDDGLDLIVDLNFNPAAWAESMNEGVMQSLKEGVSTPPSTHHTETGSKNNQNTISSLDNITVDTENRAADSIAPRTNSSLGPHSTDGNNSHSKPHPADTTHVNSRSSASTLHGTPVEVSESQEGVPVVRSSCLLSDVQNNIPLDMLDGALGNNVIPQESVRLSAWSEGNHAPAADDSIQPSSPGYSCPRSVEKEPLDGTSGVQPGHDDTNETPMENVLTEAMPMEEDNCNGDRLSSQLARQTVAELPATDAGSADRPVSGNVDLRGPTPSSAALDNATTTLAVKHGSKTANSHDSVDKKRPCDTEELHGVPTRNIRFNLRSASARQTKPSPRRSARLVRK